MMTSASWLRIRPATGPDPRTGLHNLNGRAMRVSFAHEVPDKEVQTLYGKPHSEVLSH